MKLQRVGVVIVVAFALLGCRPAIDPATSASPGLALTVQDWDLPLIAAPAAQPDLIATPEGLLLSWLQVQDGGHSLQLAAHVDGQWHPTRAVARGEDWFVNWADTPHVAVSGSQWWAHWLQKSSGGVYAYDVRLSRSGDAGKTWSVPVTVHTDGTASEHGFVSMWPEAGGGIGLAWLDGRNVAASTPDSHSDHGHGAMSLRASRFDADGNRAHDVEIDARTCDCCQTAVAVSEQGPLLVYRDRDPHEIRDIAISRFDGQGWTPPRYVHQDHWKMPGCPVNGPAIAARDRQVWVAWYTAANNLPRVRLAYSSDAGASFSAPVEVDAGNAVQGRVAVSEAGAAVWVLWLREDAQGQTLQLARYRSDLSGEPLRVTVASLQGRGRGTGFPQMAVRDGKAYLLWTDVIDGVPRLHGAQVIAP